jgi:hypothetical protein
MRLRTSGLAVAATVLAACTAVPTPSPSTVPVAVPTPSVPPSPAVVPSRAGPTCNPAQLAVAAGGWGGAGGTMFVLLHVRLASGAPCELPGYPAVELRDRAGQLVASGSSQDPSTVPLATTTDLRLAWASWCASPPPGPLRARLAIGSGFADVVLPAELTAAPCQGVPTGLYVEPALPHGT